MSTGELLGVEREIPMCSGLRESIVGRKSLLFLLQKQIKIHTKKLNLYKSKSVRRVLPSFIISFLSMKLFHLMHCLACNYFIRVEIFSYHYISVNIFSLIYS